MEAIKKLISEIKINPNNPRIIKDDKFKGLVQSVRDFPEMLELRPIVVNKDMIILWGNMRYKACKEAWLKEIPVIVADNLTEEQEREFLIKDNVSGGEWDWDILANEWDKEELEEWWLDVQFETVEPEAQEDDFEVDEGIKTDIVLGDLFEIWPHRLLCGDSTNMDDVNKLMNGEKADMVFTDPPYNVDYWNSNNPQHKSRTILNDKKTDEDWDNFVRWYMANLLAFTNWNIYISMSDKELWHMQIVFEECWWRWASFIIWVKDRLILSWKDYHSRHETILYWWNENVENRLRVEDRKQDDVWEIKRPSTSELHPTMKPIELIERMLNNSSKKNNIVLDLFWWSGSTMVACHQLNRKCYMSELDPKYVQTIINRMIKLDSTLEIKRNWVPYIKPVISD